MKDLLIKALLVMISHTVYGTAQIPEIKITVPAYSFDHFIDELFWRQAIFLIGILVVAKGLSGSLPERPFMSELSHPG